MQRIPLFLTALLVAIATLAEVPEQYRDSVPASGMFNSIVITGANPSALLPGDNNWVTSAHLASVSLADSDCIIVWPGGKISACQKPVLYRLFPDVRHYFINGLPATKADFDVIPASFISQVDSRADTLMVTTLTDVNSPGAAWSNLSNDYSEWVCEQFEHSREGSLGRPLPADILISVDHLLYTPAQALAMLTDSTLVEITGTGDYVAIDFYTRGGTLAPPANASKCVEVNVGALAHKSISAIIAASGIPVEEVNFIRYLGGRALVGSYSADSVEARSIPIKVVVSSASASGPAKARWVYVPKTMEPDGISYRITPESVISAAGLSPDQVTDITSDPSTETLILHIR